MSSIYQPQVSIFLKLFFFFSVVAPWPKMTRRKVQLGNRIRELRERAGLTREQMAAAASVSVRALVQWKLGEREPGWFNILALGQALGVDCRAFCQQPAAPAEKGGPGRPRKAGPPLEEPKQPRGRSGKGK
jgi:transcriptional regulator with XRE-family HTH domain